jgi:hypothetical protein
MTSTPHTPSVAASSPHHVRRRYLASAVAVTAPLVLFGAGTAPAYADHHQPPVPWPVPEIPLGDPIIADFSPHAPPAVASPEAAGFPGPVIDPFQWPDRQVVEIVLGPDNPASRDYVP